MAIVCQPGPLVAAARCFDCVPHQARRWLRDYLLCQILSIGVRPVLDISKGSSNGNTILTWVGGPADSFEIWRSINGAPFSLLSTVPGTSRTFTDTGVLNAGDEWDYQIRTINGSKKGNFSAIAGAGFQIFFNGNAGLTTFSFPNLVVMYSSGVNQCGANNCANLTSVNLPRLHDYINSGTGQLVFSNNALLTSINLNALARATFVQINLNASLTQLTFPSLVTASGTTAYSLDVGDNHACLSISAPVLVTGGFRTANCNILQSVSAPLLVNGLFGVNSEGGAVTSLSFPSLQTAGTLNNGSGGIGMGQNSQLLSWSLPALTTVNDAFFSDNDAKLQTISIGALTTASNRIDFTNTHSLLGADFHSLVSVGLDFILAGCSALASVNLTNLKSVGGVTDLSGTAITSLSLPSYGLVSNAGYFGAGKNGISPVAAVNLKTVSVPNVIFPNNAGIDFEGCALDAASVNGILRRGALSPGLTGAIFLLDMGTNAAPSGQGIVDKANLIAAGNTVTTN